VTVILFWVKVPVLSEQMTVTDPRVSTAGSLRISALRRTIRWAPMGERERLHGWQPFRDDRDRDCDGDDQHLGQVLPFDQQADPGNCGSHGPGR